MHHPQSCGCDGSWAGLWEQEERAAADRTAHVSTLTGTTAGHEWPSHHVTSATQLAPRIDTTHPACAANARAFRFSALSASIICTRAAMAEPFHERQGRGCYPTSGRITLATTAFCLQPVQTSSSSLPSSQSLHHHDQSFCRIQTLLCWPRTC